MTEDSALIMELLRDERAWTAHLLDDSEDYWSGQAGEERIYLARLNAEIARRIPQWTRHAWSGTEMIHTWSGKEMILRVDL